VPASPSRPAARPQLLILRGAAGKVEAFLNTATAITFTPPANANGAVSLSLSADDGTGPISLGTSAVRTSAAGSAGLWITAVNDPAVISGLPQQNSSAPTRLPVGSSTPLQSLLGSTTPLSLSDLDLSDYGGVDQLTLAPTNAVVTGITAGSHAGGASVSASGSSWIATGSLAQLNALLADPALGLNPTAGGAVALDLSVNDRSGTPGASITKSLFFVALGTPQLSGVPASGSPRALVKGKEESLSFLAISDPDAAAFAASSPALPATRFTLTISDPGSAGSLFGLKDADATSPGTQLTGTAATINALLASGRFQAAAIGATSLQFSLSNGVSPAQASRAYFSASNAAPTLTSVAPISGAAEDSPFNLSFAALALAANAADAGGSVVGFVVTSVDASKGSLSINGSAWDATTNRLIDADRKATWVPVADSNGTISDAFTVQAIDNDGATSATAIGVPIVVAAVN
jgi:hypothetical protein